MAQPRTGNTNAAFRVVTRVSLCLMLTLIAALAYDIAVARSFLVVGVDYVGITAAASRWLHGGSFYEPWQVAGSYAIHLGQAVDVLYPPVILWLVVPFVFLPAALWWAVPMTATLWAFVRLRPAPWTWPVLLVLFVWPYSWAMYLWGNPGMWVFAAEVLGLVFGWPAVLVLIKPTLAPFGLVGAHRRSWWIALGVLAIACLPFGTLWLDWIRAVVINPTNSAAIGYSLPYLPIMLLPLVAWLGRDGRALRGGVAQLRGYLRQATAPSPRLHQRRRIHT